MHRLAIVLVALGCSNAEDPAPAAGDSPAPEAKPSNVAAPAANDDARRCADGEPAACRDAGMFAEGCLHGDGASCAEAAKAQPSEAPRWLARACRRGHGADCDGVNDSIELEANETPKGPVAERIASVYRHSIGDCFAEGDAKPETTVTVVVKRESAGDVATDDPALRKCVEAQMTGWVFPNVADVAKEVSVTFAIKKPPEAIAAPDDAAIEEAISNSALMAVLAGEGGEGGRFSKMDGDRGAELTEALDDIKHKGKVARGSVEDRRELGRGRAPAIGGRPRPGVKVRSRVKMGSLDGETTLEPADVVRRIRALYLRGIKACHERALKTDATLGGKASLRFTVGETGRVTSARARGFDPGVDSCITGLMKKWRFPVPKGADGKPATATFSLPIVLKPGS